MLKISKYFLTVIFISLFVCFFLYHTSSVFGANTCGGTTSNSYNGWKCGQPLQPGGPYRCLNNTVTQPGLTCATKADGLCAACGFGDWTCNPDTTGCSIQPSGVYYDSDCPPGQFTVTCANSTPTPTPIPCHDCAYYGATCGSITNNCGNTLSCGSCSGSICSGCYQQNSVCSNNKCVYQSPGTPSSSCNSACTTKTCLGCMYTGQTCNASGQCQTNSATGVASSTCNYTCTGTWVNSSGQTCGQTCSNTGTCTNNSATCPTPPPSPNCVAGTGTTNASCGNTQTSCSCNGATCQTQGYQCSAGQCVSEWALGSSCAQSSCNGGAGCSATPTPSSCQMCSNGVCGPNNTQGTCNSNCNACPPTTSPPPPQCFAPNDILDKMIAVL